MRRIMNRRALSHQVRYDSIEIPIINHRIPPAFLAAGLVPAMARMSAATITTTASNDADSNNRNNIGSSNITKFPDNRTNDSHPTADTSSDTNGRPTLKFGETVQVDMGGPIVLNANGTTSRINNWEEMTEIEQQMAWKMIPKRNEVRRAKLLLQEKEEQEKEAN